MVQKKTDEKSSRLKLEDGSAGQEGESVRERACTVREKFFFLWDGNPDCGPERNYLACSAAIIFVILAHSDAPVLHSMDKIAWRCTQIVRAFAC